MGGESGRSPNKKITEQKEYRTKRIPNKKNTEQKISNSRIAYH
jgi:hypothetical protein